MRKAYTSSLLWATVLGLCLGLGTVSHAQQGVSLGNLPPNTVVGRLGASQSGPGQAIPFATLLTQLNGLTTVVSSISNSDGTLTISPTSGAAVASLNLAHANTWTATQTISGGGLVVSAGNFQVTSGGAETVTTLTSPRTSSWWSNDTPPANINRFGDRLFVGDAATNLTAGSGTCGTDWFGVFEGTTSNGACAYISSFVIVGDSKSNNNVSTGGVFGAGQTSTSNVFPAFGTVGFAVNNNLSTVNNAWAGYFECDQTVNNSTACYGLEVNIGNLVSNGYAGQPDPFQQSLVVGLQDACGSGISSPSTFECGAAMQIQANTKTFNTGIVFGNGSITANAAAGSLTGAIEMPVGYSIIWYSATGVAKGSITIDSSGNVLLAGTGALKFNGTSITVP